VGPAEGSARIKEPDALEGSDSGYEPGWDVGRGPNALVPPRGSTVTVQPTEIDDILYNPGMGFADFHLGFGNPPLPPSQHPRRR
jgi:hypothetical protein